MLIMGWINLQKSSAYALQSSNARGSARDAISRISSELRDCQPTTLPTATPSPTTSPALFVTAQPMEAVFYSAYNQLGVANEGTGTGALRLTRIWLSTAGPRHRRTYTGGATPTATVCSTLGTAGSSWRRTS